MPVELVVVTVDNDELVINKVVEALVVSVVVEGAAEVEIVVAVLLLVDNVVNVVG